MMGIGVILSVLELFLLENQFILFYLAYRSHLIDSARPSNSGLLQPTRGEGNPTIEGMLLLS